jgi:hypothetical protein
MNNRTFSGENFFEVLCMEANLYYFRNQGKYASNSKGLNGWMSVWQNLKKKKKNCNYLAIVPLTKRNVSRDITASSITRSLGKCSLKILAHESN